MKFPSSTCQISFHYNWSRQFPYHLPRKLCLHCDISSRIHLFRNVNLPHHLLRQIHTSSSSNGNLSALHAFLVSVSQSTTLPENSPHIPKYSQLTRSQKKKLLDATEGWSREQLRDYYAYYRDKSLAKHHSKMGQQVEHGLHYHSSTVGEESNNTTHTSSGRKDSQSIPEHVKGLLLKYLEEENDLKWEILHSEKFSTNTMMKRKQILRQTILQRKNQLMNETGLTRRQLNDQLLLLSRPSLLKVTSSHKKLIADFLRSKLPAHDPSSQSVELPNLSAEEKDQLQRKTSLTRRQLNTQIRIIGQTLCGAGPRIQKHHRQLVLSHLERTNFQRPSSLDRAHLLDATGLTSKQLSALITRLRTKHGNESARDRAISLDS